MRSCVLACKRAFPYVRARLSTLARARPDGQCLRDDVDVRAFLSVLAIVRICGCTCVRFCDRLRKRRSDDPLEMSAFWTSK